MLKRLNMPPYSGSRCSFVALSAFTMIMVTTTPGLCTCFPFGRVKSLWQANIHENTSAYRSPLLEIGLFNCTPLSTIFGLYLSYEPVQNQGICNWLT